MTATINYDCGIPGLTITALAYAIPLTGGAGVEISFSEVLTSPGYYSVSEVVGGGGIAAGMNWFQISANGAAGFDKGYANIVDGQPATIEESLAEASGTNLSTGTINEIAAAVASGLGGASITLVSPLSSDGKTLFITTGDSYTAANGQNLKFNITNQPGLVGTTPRLRLSGMTTDFADAPAITLATQQIVFNDVPSSATENLTPTTKTYQIRFDAGGGNFATPIRGQAQIVQGL